MLAEFGQLRVHMISQSSNNLNLTFVVDEEVVDALLPHLHDLLIRAGALRAALDQVARERALRELVVIAVRPSELVHQHTERHRRIDTTAGDDHIATGVDQHPR